MALPPITKRGDKGLALTYQELDNNFTNLDERIKLVANSQIDLSEFDTGDIAEGENLYYTTGRVNSAIDNRVTKSFITGFNLTTSDIAEGSRQYWTTARGNAAIDARVTKSFVAGLSVSTDDLVEGSNLFYTNSRVNSAIDARVTQSFVDGLKVDAGSIDGLNSSSFLRSNANDTFTGTLTVSGDILFGTNRAYHEGYHPNADEADKLTSSRTISLSGDASGSVSFDGSNDVTINVSVANSVNSDTLDGLHAGSFVRGDDVDNGTVFVSTDNADLVFKDSTNSITNYIWRRADTKVLNLGTDDAAVVFRGPTPAMDNGDIIWHQGNMGPESGLNADMLDGMHASEFAQGGAAFRDYGSSDTDITALISGSTFGKIFEGPTNGHVAIGIRGNDNKDGFYILDTGNDPAGDYAQSLLGVNNDGIFYKGGDVWHDGNGGSKVGASISSQLNFINALDAREPSDVPGSNGDTFYMPAPDDPFLNNTLRLLFSRGTPHSSWAGVLTAKAWNNEYNTWQLAGPASNSGDARWFLREGVSGSWSSWNEIWHSGNDGVFVKTDRATDYVDFVNHESTDYNVNARLYFDSSVGMYVKAENAPKHSNPAALWSSANFNAGTDINVSYDGEDCPTLSVSSSTSDSDNTLVKRNGSADIYARLFRSTYSDGSIGNGAAVMMRNDRSGDNYLRPVSSGNFMSWFSENVISKVNFGGGGDYITWSTGNGLQFYENGNWTARVGPSTRLPTNTMIGGGHPHHTATGYNESGAIVFCKKTSGGTIDLGETTFGSNLDPSGTDETNGGFGLTGTWQALGRAGSGHATLFRRL